MTLLLKTFLRISVLGFSKKCLGGRWSAWWPSRGCHPPGRRRTLDWSLMVGLGHTGSSSTPGTGGRVLGVSPHRSSPVDLRSCVQSVPDLLEHVLVGYCPGGPCWDREFQVVWPDILFIKLHEGFSVSIVERPWYLAEHCIGPVWGLKVVLGSKLYRHKNRCQKMKTDTETDRKYIKIALIYFHEVMTGH